MSVASEPKRCPKCGGPIPAEAPQGLCPQCLLLQASIPTEFAKSDAARPAPPTRAELAAAFPQLEILEMIGQGGMGFVFKARQPKLERLVALKILPQSLAADPAFAERFTREGRVLARLNHANIVTVHDFGQANGFFYLLMEFVDGVNLRQAMNVGRFTPAQALAVVPKICEALQFAHNEGVLHRDIKPENILLDSKGRVKIADFGIAKLVGMGTGVPTSSLSPGEGEAPGGKQVGLTETGKVLGTPHYMAPEQLEHPQDVDQRADIYSLGVVFYEMLTGELPLGRFPPPSEKSAADPRVDEVVLRALQKEPERRQKSADEVKTQVETIATTPGRAIVSTPATVALNAAPYPRNDRTRHLVRGAAAAVAVFVLTIFGATVLTFLAPEFYQATARIKFDPVSPATTGSSPSLSFDPYLLQTEWETIHSEVVLSRVLDRLNLQQRWGQRFGVQPTLPPLQALALLRGGMEIRPLRNAMLLDVSFLSEQPTEAAEIANAIVENYAAYCSDRIRAFEQARKTNADDLGFLATAHGLVHVEIIDRATPPVRPSRPNKSANIALGVLAGILLGLISGVVVGLASKWRSRRSARAAEMALTPQPDRFWRWFAVALFALIAIPIGLAALSILSGIAIPTFMRERQHAGGQPPPASVQGPAASRPLTQSMPDAKLVLEYTPYTVAHREPGALDWGFKAFVPPNHLASFLFVRWTNGVPVIDPGFSAYYKVGAAGGIDIPFCSLSCYPVPQSPTNATDTQLADWSIPGEPSGNLTNVVQWNVNLGLGFTSSRLVVAMPAFHGVSSVFPQRVRSGHQRAFRLVDFDRVQSDTRPLPLDQSSGIELRILLEPLQSPPIRMLPNETDHTNYIAGQGLPGTMEEAVRSIQNLPLDP